MTIFSLRNSYAQDTSLIKKIPEVKTWFSIPHKTAGQLFMWPHRIVALEITKPRAIKYDTSYIQSYSKRFVVTLPVSTRFLQFSLHDIKSGNRLAFNPNMQYNLGISVSSRWASFTVNAVKLSNSNINIKGQTKYKDYQFNFYGRKITTDMFVQSYSGFYIGNSKSYAAYTGANKYAIRNDVNALNIEVSSYYIVNHKKFSYRNSFGFTERQKKSAGSMLLGVYYSYFNANANSGLVTPPFRSSFDPTSYISNAATQNFGLNLGYIYTFVYKKFYATASLVQGIGGEYAAYKRDDNTNYFKLVAGGGKLNIRTGLGYDNGRYFIGTMGIFDYFLFNGNLSTTFNYTSGKFMAYVGYRFSVLKDERKMLRKLKLIDY
ncbi:MAG: DUF4421 family protein [Bacteroidia bacterium]